MVVADHVSGALAGGEPGVVPATIGVLDGVATVGLTAEEIRRLGALDGEDESSTVNGTYAFTVTPEAARKAGATDSVAIDENTGDFTVTFFDGVWTMSQVFAIGPDAGTTWNGVGDYAVEGGRLTWYWSHENGAWSAADVVIGEDGSLSFSGWEDPAQDPNALALTRAMFDHWDRTDD